MPIASLVTPQFVRVVAPRYGLEGFFAGFALVPLLLIPAVWMVRQRGTATLQPARRNRPEVASRP